MVSANGSKSQSKTSSPSLSTEPPIKKQKIVKANPPIQVDSLSDPNTTNDSAIAPAAATQPTSSSSVSGSSANTGGHATPALQLYDAKSARFVEVLADAPFQSPLIPNGFKGALLFCDTKCVLLAQVEAAFRTRVHQSLWNYIASTLLTRVRDARPFGDLDGNTLLPLNSLLEALPVIEKEFSIKF